MKQARQGDIFLIKTEKIDEDFSNILQHRIVAEGEITGHKHELNDGKIHSGTPKQQTTSYLELENPSKITHDEHKEIALDSGIYEVRRQREYNGRSNRFVSD